MRNRSHQSCSQEGFYSIALTDCFNLRKALPLIHECIMILKENKMGHAHWHQIIYLIQNYLSVSTSVDANLLIMHSVNSAFLKLHEFYVELFTSREYSCRVFFFLRNSKLNMNQIQMFSHLPVLGQFWNKHTLGYSNSRKKKKHWN